jgi:hydrogenase-1 operon protein HyaF
MRGLDDVRIRVESVSFRHNALPVLYEIRHALQRLAEGGGGTVIDLRAIPFGPGDEELLLEVLGRGEVNARVDALGPTLVRETAYAGVWLVDYRNAEDVRVALQLEVAEVPALLRAQSPDLAEAAQRLEAHLAGLAGGD